MIRSVHDRDRRKFVLGTASLALAGGMSRPGVAVGPVRVVVVGGGFGGATCARYLKRLNPTLDVTLVERDRRFLTCPFSNLVLAGLRNLDEIGQGYGGVRADGVTVVHDSATALETDRSRVRLAGGSTLDYDRLVVAPGIDLRFDAVTGYDAKAVEFVPHAWQAGPQTSLLRRQLTALDDGGLVIIAAPANPFRCPPGPYERASLIAHYLARHKPRSKILILDAKDKFSKQALFEQGWARRYPGMIEWVAGSNGGIVERVDAAKRMLVTESGFTEHSGAVVNFIPPQRAGRIARDAALADDSGWCPVAPDTFESTRIPGVHVIGDAAIAGAMPKSGFSANSQGKQCAAAIVAALGGLEVPQPSFANTCYSLVAPDYGISVSAVYRVMDGAIGGVPGAGGVSPKDADPEFRAAEARHAYGWYQAITTDTWG